MKKIITGILAVLYLSTSAGANIHMHYCMGKLVDWGLTDTNSKPCEKCGMKKSEGKTGCCNDENKFVKNNTDQKTTNTGLQMIKSWDPALPVSFIEIPSYIIHSSFRQTTFSHSPPRSIGVEVYIRNCVFLI